MLGTLGDQRAESGKRSPRSRDWLQFCDWSKERQQSQSEMKQNGRNPGLFAIID